MRRKMTLEQNPAGERQRGLQTSGDDSSRGNSKAENPCFSCSRYTASNSSFFRAPLGLSHCSEPFPTPIAHSQLRIHLNALRASRHIMTTLKILMIINCS